MIKHSQLKTIVTTLIFAAAFAFLLAFPQSALASDTEANNYKIDDAALSSNDNNLSKCLNHYFKDVNNGKDDDPMVITMATTTKEFELTGVLQIQSNTTFVATGYTITAPSDVMFKNGTGTKEAADANYTYANGSYGYKNISFVGGTYKGNSKATDPMFQLAYINNLSFKDCTFQDVYDNHHVEVAAADNITFEGCTFKGQIVNAGENTYASEALEFDISNNEFGNYNLSNTEANIYPCTNVTVTGCTFDSVNRGLGTHRAQSGKPYNNFTITNNTFSNIKYVNSMTKDVESLTSKTVKRRAIGIINTQNVTISGNTIDCGTDGIIVVGDCSGTSITGNNITAGKNGVTVREATTADGTTDATQLASISDNTFACKESAIQVDTSTITAGITDNTITGGDTAINIKTGSVVSEVSSNTINSPSTAGIKVLDSSKVTTIASNPIAGTPSGIIVSISDAGTPGGYVSTITQNTITGATNGGIKVAGTGAKADTVSYNTITDCTAAYGIGCVTNGYIDLIEHNTITNTAKPGITVNDNGNCAKIFNNSITKQKSFGLMVQGLTSDGYVLDIKGNTIDGCSKAGMFIKSCTKGKSLSKNTITNCGKCGIMIYSSKIKKVDSNTIKGSTKAGFFLSKTRILTSMSKNKLTSKKTKTGIYMDTASYIKKLANNTIYAKRFGIYKTNSKCVIDKNIKNKFKGCADKIYTDSKSK